MRKELEISAKFDTSDFDKSIENMQKKLRELYAPSDMIKMQGMTNQRLQQAGQGGSMSGAGGPGAYSAATQRERREIEQTMATQVREQEKLAKIIVQRQELMKRMESQQKSMVQGSQEELRVREQINRMEENQFRLRENYKQRDAALNQMAEARDRTRPQGFGRIAQAFDKGGIGGAIRAGGRMLNNVNPITGTAAVFGGIAGATEIASSVAGYGQRLEEARGSAVSGTVGQDLSRVYSGKGNFEQAWMGERKAAEGLAKQKADRDETIDSIKGIASVAAIGVGALMTATGVGAVPGIALMASGAYGLSNDRTRATLSGGPEYQQLLAAQRAQDFRGNLENLKNQDPQKKLLMGDYEQNMMRDVGIQRTLGIGDSGMYGRGGFLNQVHNAGFLSEQGIGMANSIVGAGGSARMGREAGFGLGMERAGMTNAAGILGSLSGGIQSTEATKRATIGIMAEAFKIGLDNTEFAEENRRFTQAAANIIGKSGATSESDQDRMSRTLGMFVGGRTNQGISAAGSAYERYQSRGSDVSGRRGQIRMNEAMKNPILSTFAPDDLTELLAARPDQLQEGSAFLQSYVEEYNQKHPNDKKTAKDIIASLQPGMAASRFLLPQGRKRATAAAAKVQAYRKANNLTEAKFNELGKAGKIPGDIWGAQGDVARAMSKENSGGYNEFQSEADVGEMQGLGGQASDADKNRQLNIIKSLGTKIADKMNAGGAQGQDEARQGLVGLKVELDAATSGLNEVAAAAVGAAKAMNSSQPARNAALAQGAGTGMDAAAGVIPGTNPNGNVQVQGMRSRK